MLFYPYCCGLSLSRTDAVMLNCNHNSFIFLNCYAGAIATLTDPHQTYESQTP